VGDRTFSAEDVIRIYQDFLTSDEQETVDLFFEEMADEPERDNIFIELEIVAEAINQAQLPLPGLFGIIIRNIPFAQTLIGTVQFAVERARILVAELLELENVDA